MYKNFAGLICVFLAACLIINISFAVSALPDDIAAQVVCGGIYDGLTGEAVFVKGADEKRAVAGLGRLPKLLIVCEMFDSGKNNIDEVVEVSERAAAVSGPTAFIEAGEQISAAELLKAAVMITAGDAICALAEHCFGTYEGTIEKANLRLNELGIDVSNNSGGDGEMYSANELAAIGKALSGSATFLSYSTMYMDEILHENGKSTELVNQNRLIRNCAGCFGLATGSSSNAKYCGIFAVKRQDTVFLCVLCGCNDSKTRFMLAQSMLEWAFATYKAKVLVKSGDIIVETAQVSGGIFDSVALIAKENASMLVSQKSELKEVVNITEPLYAPLSKNEAAGSIEYYDEDSALIAKIDLYPSVDVDKATVWDRICMIMRRWIVG